MEVGRSGAQWRFTGAARGGSWPAWGATLDWLAGAAGSLPAAGTNAALGTSMAAGSHRAGGRGGLAGGRMRAPRWQKVVLLEFLAVSVAGSLTSAAAAARSPAPARQKVVRIGGRNLCASGECRDGGVRVRTCFLP